MSVVKLVTGSTVEPVTRNEMKLWLRIDEHDVAEDNLVDSLITLARQRIEEVKRRAFITQTFDYYLDCPPENDEAVDIPKAPLVSVTSIKGFATTDADDSGGTAMSTSGWYVDTANEFGRVTPLSAFSFPNATRSINPFIIRFTAGYSSASTGVPEYAKLEIKELVAKLYEHRGDEVELAKALSAYELTELDLPTWG